MRGGVCCHRGRSADSVSCSGAKLGEVVENEHAEVRTREGFEDCAGRSVDEVMRCRHRIDRFDAIEADVRSDMAVRRRCGRR